MASLYNEGYRNKRVGIPTVSGWAAPSIGNTLVSYSYLSSFVSLIRRSTFDARSGTGAPAMLNMRLLRYWVLVQVGSATSDNTPWARSASPLVARIRGNMLHTKRQTCSTRMAGTTSKGQPKICLQGGLQTLSSTVGRPIRNMSRELPWKSNLLHYSRITDYLTNPYTRYNVYADWMCVSYEHIRNFPADVFTLHQAGGGQNSIWTHCGFLCFWYAEDKCCIRSLPTTGTRLDKTTVEACQSPPCEEVL